MSRIKIVFVACLVFWVCFLIVSAYVYRQRTVASLSPDLIPWHELVGEPDRFGSYYGTWYGVFAIVFGLGLITASFGVTSKKMVFALIVLFVVSLVAIPIAVG